MITKMIIALIFCTGFLSAQTKQKEKIKPTATGCDFVFEADTSLAGKEFQLVSYLNDGCDLYESKEMRANFATILKTKVTVTKEFFAHQFKNICILEKCALKKVGVYKMSTPGDVMLIITYNK